MSKSDTKNIKVQENAIIKALQDFLLDIPTSRLSKSETPEADAKKLVDEASLKSGAISGLLAIPPGPLGVFTIIPDLISIWKIQAQLVADISALYGKTAFLTKETMAFCLFKHGGMHLFKDIVIRAGERFLVKRTSLRVFQKVISLIGIKITQRVISKTISRWVPIIGAVFVGFYSSLDTKEIGKNAIELMKSELSFQENGDDEDEKVAV